MGPRVLARLAALLFLAPTALAQSPADGAARSLEDHVRASDLIVLGHLVEPDGPDASLRLKVEECLLGDAAPGEVLRLDPPAQAPSGPSIWMLTLGHAGRWESVGAGPRAAGWRDEIVRHVDATGMRLSSPAWSSRRGEPALVELELRNTDDRPRQFPLRRHEDGRLDPGSLDVRVERLTPSGPVPVDPRPRYARIACSDGVTVVPGERWSTVVDLTEVVEFRDPGTYRILVSAGAPWGSAETRLLLR